MPVVDTTITFQDNDQVTASKLNSIMDNSVFVSGAVVAGNGLEVVGGQLRIGDGPNGITTAKIADSAITTAKIENSTSATTGVTTAKIANSAITTDKIANGAVTASKIASGVIISSVPSNFPIQIVGATKSDIQSVTTSPTNWIDISSLSVTLTRRVESASGKVRIQASISSSVASGAHGVMFRIVRGSTVIGVGDAAGSRQLVTNFTGYPGSTTTGAMSMANIDYIDSSPGSDSTVTYKIQSRSSSGSYYINRGDTDTDSTAYGRAISTLTLTELAP
jgi:hypothetical protein